MSTLLGLVVQRIFHLTSAVSLTKFMPRSPLFHCVYSNVGSCNVFFPNADLESIVPLYCHL